MKKTLLMAGAAVMILASCNTSTKTPQTEQDSVAYAVGIDLGNYVKQTGMQNNTAEIEKGMREAKKDINKAMAHSFGINMGNRLKQQDSTLSQDMVIAAMNGVVKGDTSMMTIEEALAFLETYYTVKRPAKLKAEYDAYLTEIEARPGVQKTESGLLYQVVNEGTDEKATSDNDTVMVTYEGTLKDGSVFDSSRNKADSVVTFTLDSVIKGWTEGMKLVGKGGKIKLWVPSELGYGSQPNSPFGPYEVLAFDVDLVDVKHAE